MEQVSTIVVINGEAIIAGSKPTRFAKSGKIQPINLERITVTIKDKATTKAIFTSWYIKKILIPFASAKILPTNKAIRNYLKIT